MTETPEVTLLLPVHNAEGTLDEALSDVSAQRGVAFEALVVLNGITDGSEAIARRWAIQDPRIQVLTSTPKGIVPALNLGLSRARAPLIARLDADDRMAPDRLAKQAAAMDAHPSWTVCTTQVRSGAVSGGPAGPGMTRLVARLNTLDTHAAMRAARFIDIPVVHPAVMFRRDAVLSIGGYLDGDFGEVLGGGVTEDAEGLQFEDLIDHRWLHGVPPPLGTVVSHFVEYDLGDLSNERVRAVHEFGQYFFGLAIFDRNCFAGCDSGIDC